MGATDASGKDSEDAVTKRDPKDAVAVAASGKDLRGAAVVASAPSGKDPKGATVFAPAAS